MSLLTLLLGLGSPLMQRQQCGLPKPNLWSILLFLLEKENLSSFEALLIFEKCPKLALE